MVYATPGISLDAEPPAVPRGPLRREMRERRRRLPPTERARLSRLVAGEVARTRAFRGARHVAVYLARDGELDLQPLVERAWAAGKRTYLPALWRGRLAFLPHQRDSAMRRNRFGIPEPAVGPRRRASPCALDLVLMPLVAFGAGGARLGMGGGFYDRTFAASVHRRHWRRPLLVGVGYAFQRVQPLPAQPWDVPLHGVVTEAGAEWF